MPGILIGTDIKYTLYIDESGDFESPRGQWVVAGVLVDSDYTAAEKKLKASLDCVPRDLGLSSIRDFHLTEFRREFGHEDANSKAIHLLGALGSCVPNFHGIAVVNLSKSCLSEREKTYRLMLSDLLALCETALPDDELIDGLDVVVASRTIDGVRQTSVSDIHQDVIKSLPIALEVDLATRGLLELTGKKLKVHMDYANNSWGLVCADFLANLTYHSRKSQEGEILRTLESKGRYTVFESAGGLEVRRAHVAERNGDYALAVCRWVELTGSYNYRPEATIALHRLFDKIFTRKGTTGPEIAFEEIVERLWRPHSSPRHYPNLARTLEWFEGVISDLLADHSHREYSHFLFRLRNLQLIIYNHMGNTAAARRIIDDQHRAVGDLAGNPEHFSRLLDFKVAEAETAINSLDLDKALTLALEYKEVVYNYRTVWELITDLAKQEDFERSRLYIKTEMSLIRIGILCLEISDVISAPEISARLDDLEISVTRGGDLSRLQNYRIMFLLRQGKPDEAMCLIRGRFSSKEEQSLSMFDLFWLLRSVNDALLSNKGSVTPEDLDLVEAHIRSINVTAVGHPNDIVTRELALLEFMKGDISKAKRLISKSQRMMDYGESEIGDLLQGINSMHEDHIFGRRLSMESCFVRSVNTPLVLELLDKEDPSLQEARFISPY